MPTDDLQLVAMRIRELREDTGGTQEDTAKYLNVDEKQYKEYEEGTGDIPISVLYKLAVKFGVDITELLTGSSPKLDTYCLVRKDKGIETERFKGYSYHNLAYKFKNRKFEPLLVTLSKNSGASKAGLVTHGGHEFNYCLEGIMKLVWGNKEIILNEGDSIFFDPSQPHGQEVVGEKEAKFLTIILEG